MIILLQKEFVQMRSYLLQTIAVVSAFVLIFGMSAPDKAMTYLATFSVVFAMILPQMSFTLEERSNTTLFLRALPIKPWEIIAAKYLVSLISIAIYSVVLAGYNHFVVGGTSFAPVSGVLIVSSLFAAISLFLHVWLGLKSAKSAMLGIIIIAALPTMLATTNPQAISELFSYPIILTVVDTAGTATGVAFASIVGLLLMLLSFASSAAIFTQRDVSRLP